MALSPLSLLMQRRGPALPPGGMGSAPTAGAVPPQAGAPGTAPNGAMLEGILSKLMAQQSAVGGTDYPVRETDNLKRLVAVMMAHLTQSHPKVATHYAAAWRALDQASKELQASNKSMSAAGPPLGFSGAQQSDTGTSPIPNGAF